MHLAPTRSSRHTPRARELTRKMEEADHAVTEVKGQLAASQDEVRFAQQRLSESEVRSAARADQQKASNAENQQLQSTIRELRNTIHEHKDRVAEEEAQKERDIAEGRGPPPPAEQVQQEMLQAFDTAAATVSAELAEKAGVRAVEEAEGDGFVVGADGLDSASMIEAGVPVEAMAEQYLRAAMERAATAVEPARLQAVAKWRNEASQRRDLQNQLQELKGSIRVFCRVRPPGPGEGEAAVSTPSETECALTQPSGKKSFAFDHVFGAATSQEGVFEEVEPVLDSVLAGFNVCIFAYGQTGSGKTFTMEGIRDDDSKLGINPRALRRIFELISDKKQFAALGGAKADDGWEYEVKVAYLEIYNENVKDLLGPVPGPKDKKAPASLDVRMSAEVVHVPDLTVVPVASAEEVERVLLKGVGRRSTAATKCNSQSSRSHSIVQVSVTGRHSKSGASTHGKLHLVDLAGSERVKKSDVSGKGMTEAQNINKCAAHTRRRPPPATRAPPPRRIHPREPNLSPRSSLFAGRSRRSAT